MSEHTPTPWKTGHRGDNTLAIYGRSNKTPISVFHDEGGEFPEYFDKKRKDANAEFIVRACNVHDDLVAALEGVIRIADRKTVEFDAAHAALAKAKGE